MPQAKGSAVKEMRGQDRYRIADLAEYGREVDQCGWELMILDELHEADTCEKWWAWARQDSILKPTCPKPNRAKQIAEFTRVHGRRIVSEMLESMRDGNVMHFETLTKALVIWHRAQTSPNDRLRLWLTYFLPIGKGRVQTERLTTGDLRKHFKRLHGIEVSDRTMRNACTDVGLKFKDGRGRPKDRNQAAR